MPKSTPKKSTKASAPKRDGYSPYFVTPDGRMGYGWAEYERMLLDKPVRDGKRS